ncbi:MAG: site-2 protease family protein [Spirochaetales bacterium]|nr:site-2 protease family protein [Spirochaetales bacterium]
MNILLGLIGFGIVVFVHELGHFLAAKLSGIEVEAFSLGWGPRIVGFKRGGTDYRLSALPIGGYCRMKGEDAFRSALERNASELPREKGSYYGAPAWKRIIVSFAGPFFNLVFAFLVFMAVYGSGYTVTTFDSRILLAGEVDGPRASGPYAAELAGLRSGDRIISIDGEVVEYFAQVQETVSMSGGRDIRIEVERDGETLELVARPEREKASGAGKLGVYPMAEPLVTLIEAGGPADIAGIRVGDRLVEAEGKPLAHAQSLQAALRSEPETLDLLVEREGSRLSLRVVPRWNQDGQAELGFALGTVDWRVEAGSLAEAIGMGFAETSRIVTGTLRGIAGLFAGVDPLKAVSGPARITVTVGETAARGFRDGLGEGFSVAFSFLAMLSIGLFVMNLLPIPVLDGGWILLFLFELVRGKAPKPKNIFRYQSVGMVIVLGIFLLAMAADFMFFAGR